MRQPRSSDGRLHSMKTSSRAALLAVTALALASSVLPSGRAAPASEARPTVLDVRGLDQGEPPAIAWAERKAGGTVIHGPDGTTTPVADELVAFAPMGSGYVVQTGLERPTTVRWIGADGTPGRREWRTGHGLAVSARGKAIAFAGRNGRVWTIDKEGDRHFRFNRVPMNRIVSAAAVTGENCKEGEGKPGYGCMIAVNGPHRTFYTNSHGIVDRVPRLRQTTTGRNSWLGGITSVSDMGSCSAMLRTWRVKWRTCDNQLSDISPGNDHVIGTPAYADGFGPGALDILDLRDGSIVRAFTYARNQHTATYFDEVWEDADHVLVVTYQDGKWAIVRLGVDGSMEYAVAPRKASMDDAFPFRLQTR